MEALGRITVALLSILSLCGPTRLLMAQSVVVNSPKLRIVDGTNYPRSSQGIQSAIKDMGQSPGTVFLSPGVYDISAEIQVAQPGIRIVGQGIASTVLSVSNPTANVFNVTGSRFELVDVGFKSTVQKTGGSLVVMAGAEGLVHNVRIEGNFWDGFTGDSPSGGVWTLDTIRVIGPASWNYFIGLRSPVHTIAGTHVHNLSVSQAITWKSASIVLDTGVDTFICSDSDLGPIVLRSTLGPQAPRWIRFTNTLLEAGVAGKVENTGLQIEAVRDFRFLGGYIGTSQFGVAIGSGARGVHISNTEFVNIGRSAVSVDAGARDVSVTESTFEDIGVESNGKYDAVVIAPGAVDFNISYNTFESAQPNRPRYNLLLPAKCATCIADGNRFGGFVTGSISGGK